eukprot:scaffold1912_cov167-Amphora_coffeaeformis.AAC.27
MSVKVTDIGEAPFVEVLSYLSAREISLVQTVCRGFRQNSAMAWMQMEKNPQLLGKLGQDMDPKARCCRFDKAQRYAQRMEETAQLHYDYNDPEPTHVKCWCCRSLPNLEARAFRCPQKFEFFCRFSSRMAHEENKPKVIWEGFRPATKISYSGLSLNGVHEIFQNVKLHEAFGTYMFQSSEQNFVTMCDVTDSLMVTVVAVEKAHPWRSFLVLATGGFHDCTTTHDDTGRCFRFHPRMVRSHGIISNEDYITAGFLTSTERLGDSLQDCHLVLEHQW